MICKAYEIGIFQVEGIPDIFEKAYWDIEAKPEEGKYPLKNGILDPQLGSLMVQSMLEDHFKLKVHRETRIMKGYELVIARGGHKLTPVKNPEKPKAAVMSGHLRLSSMPVYALASGLSMMLNFFEGEKERFHVVDKTGLEGSYNIDLRWTPNRGAASIASQNQASDFSEITIDDPEITIFDAIEDQLGLKLVPAKVPTPVIVVDSVQMPTSN